VESAVHVVTRSKTDHIVVHERGLRLECLNCGDTYRGTLPCSVDVWLAAAKAFGKVHARCQPRVEQESTEGDDDGHGI
jgi:hypothetical protein